LDSAPFDQIAPLKSRIPHALIKPLGIWVPDHVIGTGHENANRWYREYVPVADRLYDDHLAELELKAAVAGMLTTSI
jgi:hypothetical protein